MELQQHHFTIEHRAGKHNANADALSRMYDEEEEQLNECFMIGTLDESWDTDVERELQQWNDNNIESEKENEWHISSNNIIQSDEEKWFEDELAQQYSNTPLITIIDYESPKSEMEEIYRTNIKIKQVIANQPITKGGSQCTFACDTENHHIHTYCKMCKKNLHYGLVIHDCTIGFGRGKIQPDMDPGFLINNPWWNEPLAVRIENNVMYLQYLQNLIGNSFNEELIAELD